MEQNIVFKGIPQKNKVASIINIIGILLLPISFIVSYYMFNNGKGHTYYGGPYSWDIIYDTFGEFYVSEFVNFKCFYGYMIFLGVIAVIVGTIIKINTEKCEITVTNNSIYGKLPHKKEVDIPLNQITAIHKSSFNGISITSIGNISNFHCIENSDEVIKAISYLLANSQQDSNQISQHSKTTSLGTDNGAEQLRKLKNLLDSDIITQEEFNAKKKEIIGT